MTGIRKISRPEKQAQSSHAYQGYQAFIMPFAFGLGQQAPQPMPTGFLLKKYIRAATNDTIHHRIFKCGQKQLLMNARRITQTDNLIYHSNQWSLEGECDDHKPQSLPISSDMVIYIIDDFPNSQRHYKAASHFLMVHQALFCGCF